MAAGANNTIHIWDITGSDPHLVETFVGHTKDITSLAFSSPSTLISASGDRSVKFWQISALPTVPTVTNPKSTPLNLVPTKSISPEMKNCTIIPSGLDGKMNAWGILTGPHKGPLQTPAEDFHQRNIQLTDIKLILVWYADQKINVWDAEKGELLQAIEVPRGEVMDLRVSGDGSKVFSLYEQSIHAWDIWTGGAVGEVFFWNIQTGILATDGSKLWIGIRGDNNRDDQGWDFGISGSFPIRLFNKLPGKLHLNDTMVWEINTSKMKDMATGKVVFWLPERFGKVVHVQLGGQYLVVSLKSREVLILDISHMLL